MTEKIDQEGNPMSEKSESQNPFLDDGNEDISPSGVFKKLHPLK
jgi:hypothetical protein